MDGTYMTNPLIFLIDTLASLYIAAVMLRFLLQWTGAEFYNPIAQLLITVTHQPLRWLRRYVPAIGRIDTASLLLALLLQMGADYTILLLKDVSISFPALLVLSFSQLLSMLINIYIFAVFARALLSWVTAGAYHAASSLLYSLTEPLLRLGRRAVPMMGGIDLSPLVVLIVLQLMKMLLLPPLQQLTALLG